MAKPEYDVFLSHATPDKPVVEELARILKKRGFEPWLDKWNLVPGEPWQEAIEKALEDCAVCAVCLGPSGTGPWQNEEMRAAIARRVSDRSRQFRVIPILLPRSERGEPGRLPAFLRATTWVEFRETLDDEKALHRLIAGIRGLPPGSDPGEAVAEGACPYRGLQVFDVGDALFFFGREALTEWLLDKLRDRSGSRFLAIVGPSGSGKSSLARAGLLASLKSGKLPGSDLWPMAICKPGAQPLESLAIALSGAARLGDSPSALRDLIRDLGTDPSMLHLTARLSLRDAPADRRLVLLVDQFEEVFTLCPNEAERQAIINNLLHAATAAEGRTVVVLTLRADFYGRCATYPDLAAAISDRQSLVGPMIHEELRSAIERPAYLAGCELEGGLADLLLNEVESQPGSLPLLEHALLQIWDRKEGGRRLTIDAYREIGGVAGALEKHAEEVYAGFSEEEKETCRQIFLRLVQVDEQGRATKRRLGLDELAPTSVVISRLTDARLLTTDQEKQPTVELAHEALLNNWTRLKQWIEQDREALRTRRRLDEAVAEWLGKDRDSAFLLEGGRLAQIEVWAENHAGEMGPDARELLAASIAGRDQERQRELAQAKALEEEQRRRADAEHQRAEEQARARRRLKRWAVGFAITTTAALVAVAIIFYMRQISEQQRKISLAEELATRSKAIYAQNPVVATLLSIRAARLASEGGQPYLSSVEESLRGVTDQLNVSCFPTGKVEAVALSWDQQILATAGTDGMITIWNLEDSMPLHTIPRSKARSSKIRLIAVSNGGDWVLTSDIRGTTRLFKVDSKEDTSVFTLSGEDWIAGSPPFSPDGKRLLTRRASGEWALRDLEHLSLQRATILNTTPASLAFSPDGHWLAAAEKDDVRTWKLLDNIDSQAVEVPAPQVAGKIRFIFFSFNSQWLVAFSERQLPGQFLAWEIGTTGIHAPPINPDICAQRNPFIDPTLASRIPGLEWCWNRPMVMESFVPDIITAAAINIRDDWLAVGTSDGQLRVYARRDPFSQQSFRIAGPVNVITFHGHRIFVQGGQEAPRVLVVNDERWSSSKPDVISPKGVQLFRDYPEPRLLSSQGTHPVTGASKASFPWVFSPDGNWLAAGGLDGKPLVWHVNDKGTTSPPLSFSVKYRHSRAICALAFSPDGKWLCSGDQGGESRVWNLRRPDVEPWPLTNHIGEVTALAFSSDSHLIATAGRDGIVRLRQLAPNPAPPDLPDSPRPRGESETAIAFLPDGRLAIGGYHQLLSLWTSGRPEVMLDNELWEVSELLSSPHGNHFIGRIKRMGMAQIWTIDGNAVPRKPIELRKIDTNGPLAFTPDGKDLLAIDFRGKLLRLELQAEQLIKSGCRAAGRNLTEMEWRTHNPFEPYQEREPCPEFPKAFD